LAVPRPRERVCGGAKILALPYYSQRTVFASPRFFIKILLPQERKLNFQQNSYFPSHLKRVATLPCEMRNCSN